MAMTASQPSTSSAGDAYSLAPASVSGFVFFESRFHTPTSCPTAINRCAIAAPIRPVPHTPIFIFLPSMGGLRGWIVSLVRAKHAEILCDQRFVVQDIVGFAGEDTASGVEDDRLVRDVERQLAVLFDQNDGLSFFLQPLDGAAD